MVFRDYRGRQSGSYTERAFHSGSSKKWCVPSSKFDFEPGAPGILESKLKEILRYIGLWRFTQMEYVNWLHSLIFPQILKVGEIFEAPSLSSRGHQGLYESGLLYLLNHVLALWLNHKTLYVKMEVRQHVFGLSIRFHSPMSVRILGQLRIYVRMNDFIYSWQCSGRLLENFGPYMDHCLQTQLFCSVKLSTNVSNRAFKLLMESFRNIWNKVLDTVTNYVEYRWKQPCLLFWSWLKCFIQYRTYNDHLTFNSSINPVLFSYFFVILIHVTFMVKWWSKNRSRLIQNYNFS